MTAIDRLIVRIKNDVKDFDKEELILAAIACPKKITCHSTILNKDSDHRSLNETYMI